MPSLAIVWHRRDLRLQDNPALARAAEQFQQVLAVFVIDPAIIGRDDTAPARVHFLRESLAELQRAYANLGGRLVVCRGEPAEQLVVLARTLGAEAVFFNDDIEPYARTRDQKVIEALAGAGVAAHPCAEILLHPAAEVLTGQGKPYTVFTPFWRNWSAKPKPRPFAAPERLSAPSVETGTFISLDELGKPFSGKLLVTPGEQAGIKLLDHFCEAALYRYDERRDHPAEPGTSLLSAHLKFGTIGIRAVWQRTIESWRKAPADRERANLAVWQQELGWREFYKYELAHFPELAERPFRRAFEQFPYDHDRERFERWCRGETGFPFVDAAMRQLNTVSWMHNRLRMVVASFLTKDLLLPYQWGERYFMQKLVDGDLSANNGGWQWAASVGTDPKPLRIFNPSTQARRYDSEATYIRRWLPELAPVDTAMLVESERFSPLFRSRYGYPQAIVEHKSQQQIFKERYRQIHSTEKQADTSTSD
ncbi:cryptochrome/photolyase family protein [Gloeobacter kilaueensis]|uniref:Deoxyribodipyrimidine photolyase n=1 Tax=Gloeobacter kilaueensis (strain ATCC BAA-2537 / CCAP 1431/1 / ULC 316 / JS1) TaxID=1183438 RepID=U5QDP3_GLOK1|nr:deoxyribodipyrimidine photo-lyase [Gloeobacter kilaueensis]AGY56978.1 deoxyribodipyrimidine photolyase [Gloeobacter kilaueensis JS1]